MYIKFKNGEEVTTLESKRSLIGVEFKYGTNYVKIKKPIDIIRIDSGDRIKLIFQRGLDLSINQFIIGGRPEYLNINGDDGLYPILNIDKLIINETSQIDGIHKSTVNEIIVHEGARISIHLESVNVVTSYGKLNLNLSKNNTIDKEKSYISKETWFNFEIKRNKEGKIIFFFDDNYNKLYNSIFGKNDINFYLFQEPSFIIIAKHKNLISRLEKITQYPKDKLKKFVDGQAIYDYLIVKCEKDLNESKNELIELRKEIDQFNIYN